MDINKLITQLENLPNLIYLEEQRMLEAKQKLEDAKLTYEIKLAFETVASKAGNATEKKSMAILKSETERRNLLKANLEYERANASLTHLTNQFVAVRKLASIEQEMMKNQLGGT
jgi:hypothetical protein